MKYYQKLIFECDLMPDKELRSKAEKRADEKIGFYRHLYSYITVNIILAIINFKFFIKI